MPTTIASRGCSSGCAGCRARTPACVASYARPSLTGTRKGEARAIASRRAVRQRPTARALPPGRHPFPPRHAIPSFVYGRKSQAPRYTVQYVSELTETETEFQFSSVLTCTFTSSGQGRSASGGSWPSGVPQHGARGARGGTVPARRCGTRRRSDGRHASPAIDESAVGYFLLLSESFDLRPSSSHLINGSDVPMHIALHAMATASCLLGRRRPPAACSSRWHGKRCPESQVPVWQSRVDHVEACFRCCMLNMTGSARMMRNLAHWTRVPPDSWRGIDARASVLLQDLGRFADLRTSNKTRSKPAFRLAAPSWRDVRFVYLSRGGIGASKRATLDFWSDLTQQASAGGLSRGQRITVGIQGDADFPDDARKARFSIRHILDSPLVSRWLANNRGAEHPKISSFPRTPQFNRSLWAPVLRGAAAHALIETRRRLLLCSCATMNNGRAPKFQVLRRNSFACLPEPACRTAFPSLLMRSTFVASPRGYGANNYRDWEALLAGAIPLVDYSAFNRDLWAGLPVVQVTNWSEITPAYLHATLARMQSRVSEYSLSKAYLPFWLSRILEAGAGGHERE